MAYDINDNHINVYKHDSPSTKIAEVSPNSIKKLSTVEQVSYLGDELVYDTMLLDAMQERTIAHSGVTYDSQLEAFPYGSIAKYTNPSGSLERDYYVDTSKRIGTHTYEYNLVSIVGVLDRQTFTGNVVNRMYFYQLLESIVGASGAIFDYTVSNDVRNILVSGWLPYGTKRNALQQLLFATNVHMLWDETNNRVLFDYIDHSASAVEDARIFDDGKIEYPQLATRVSVTEHSFFPHTTGQDLVTVFDNTSGYAVNNEVVQFSNAPIIASTIVTEGNISCTNVTSDSAVVSGRGTIKAYPYVHTTFEVRREYNGSDRKEYNVSVTDAYLVSVMNSETVADRLADYYFNRYIVKANIRTNGESCGHYYTLKDSFLDSRTGFLQKMDKVFSSFVKASCEFLCGVNENYQSNTFSHWGILAYNPANPSASPQSGTWTVPSGVTKARIILIGGGHGGSSGLPGKPGDTSGKGGDGGEPGTPGEGGKIYEFTLDVTAGEIFDYYLGTGGAGGAALSYATYQTTQQANDGVAGGDTTLTRRSTQTVYTSADGLSSDVGWFCLANNYVLGSAGSNGGAGGKGGDAGTASDVEVEETQRIGNAGGDVSYTDTSTHTWQGGAGGSGDFVTAPNSFEIVTGMSDQAIINAGIYLLRNGVKTLVTPDAGFVVYMKNLAENGTAVCNGLGWSHKIGVAGGGGGGAAFNAAGASGAVGSNDETYPSVMCLDYDHPLRDSDEYCWHEINTTKGGNGGNGASAGYFSISALPGKGGNAGWGGGGGGGAAASRTGNNPLGWFMSEYAESATAPTPGTGGNGGRGQQGSYGCIVIYYT